MSLSDDEEAILSRAVEGGAFDEVVAWAETSPDGGADEDFHEANLEWWRRLAAVAEGLLGRPIDPEGDIHQASVAFWDLVADRRPFVRRA